ncbi:hypothetical protein ABZ826_22865 [Streptomyces sp. NPDC047515]|uniref:hypothetical protein n=1 Tax=Streptomyces sp. NPDC047515 TaxID=3155380 RepID=UPI0033EA831B
MAPTAAPHVTELRLTDDLVPRSCYGPEAATGAGDVRLLLFPSGERQLAGAW